MKNLLLLLSSLLLTLLLAIAFDRLLGVFLPEHLELIFESGTETEFETPEFHYTAKINSLGFRDHEVGVARDEKYRVMTLGDSFTFGSGVSLEDTWTKVLEREMQEGECAFEALNLGRGGRAVDGYADIAEKAIPVLKPDLVLVAVLQGDDLGQSLIKVAHQRHRAKAGEKASKAELGKEQEASFIEKVFPHFVELRRRITPNRIEMRPIWQGLAEEFEANLAPKYQQDFAAIPDEIKQMFRSGGLNPGLVSLAIKKPKHLRWTLKLQEPLVQAAIEHLASNLARIKEAASAVGAETLVLSMPSGAYTATENVKNYQAMGFDVDQSFLKKSEMDTAIELAAKENGLEHFQFTEVFRSKALESELFFPFDGHITESGQKLFAEQVREVLRQRFGGCPKS